MTGIATKRVARALPPTPMPDTKVSEKTLYTIARLKEGREEREEKEGGEGREERGK